MSIEHEGKTFRLGPGGSYIEELYIPRLNDLPSLKARITSHWGTNEREVCELELKGERVYASKQTGTLFKESGECLSSSHLWMELT